MTSFWYNAPKVIYYARPVSGNAPKIIYHARPVSGK